MTVWNDYLKKEKKKDENQTCYIYIYKSTHTHYFGLNNFSMSDLAAEHKQQK